MNTQKIIAINLKYYRYKANLSQDEFYHQLGLSAKYLACVERGEVNLTLKSLDNLAHKLHITPVELITFDKAKIIAETRIDSKKIKS